MSRNFMPCYLVRQFHVLQFHVRHFQRPRSNYVGVPLTWSVVILLRTGLVLTVQRYDPLSLLRTSLMRRFHSFRYGLTMLNRRSSMTLRSSYVSGKEF